MPNFRPPWRRPAAEPLLLLAILAFVLAVEWAWLARDAMPDLTGDDAGIARASFAQLAAWRDGVPFQPSRLLGAPYPPLVMYVGAVGAWVADLLQGDPVLGMLCGQSVYLVLLVVGAWAAVRLEGVAVAAAAALVAPLYAWWAFRGQMFVDMQLGACLVAAVGAWASSDRLRRPLPALLFGLALAAALLTKFSAVFFAGLPAAAAVGVAAAGLARRHGLLVGLSVPAATAAVVAGGAGWIGGGAAAAITGVCVVLPALAVFRAPAADLRPRLAAFALVGAGLLVAVPWYAGSLSTLRTFLGRNLGQQYDGEVLPLASVWWVYPAVLFRGVVDEPITVLALLGVLLMRRRGLSGPGWLAAAMVVSGIVLLTLQPYRTPRYVVPAAGLLVVLAVSTIGALGRARVVTAGIVAVGAAVTWVHATLARPPRPDDTSAWTNRITWVPPVSAEALAQQRAAATDRRPRVHLPLPGPTGSPFAFAYLQDALDPQVLAGVQSVALDGAFPPAACNTLALRIVAEGADPYLTCRGGQGGDLLVSNASGTVAGMVHVAGPLPKTPPGGLVQPPGERDPGGRGPAPSVHVHVSARLASPGGG